MYKYYYSHLLYCIQGTLKPKPMKTIYLALHINLKKAVVL